MTDLRQAEPPPEWPLIKNILDEYGLQAICFVAEWKAAQQQAEPMQKLVAWGVFDGNLHDMFFTEEEAQEMVRLKGDGSTVAPLYTAPPQQQAEPVAFYDFNKGFYWAKPTKIVAPTVVDVPPIPLYTTAAKREWVGLTPEEVLDMFDVNNVYGSKWIEFARTVEAALRSKNT